ncbi:acetylxylan esterase [Streptomyces sp. NPDC020996]|uniref:acetylxylan esterase n=1 Tax=Streptomyces sp. NPDC020996 TaxID=3154791 RepID=UPI0033F020FB
MVQGGSQGGGLALAVAGLAGDRVAGLLADVPFLCHYRRGAEVASDGPYVEVVKYLRRHKPDAWGRLRDAGLLRRGALRRPRHRRRPRHGRSR